MITTIVRSLFSKLGMDVSDFSAGAIQARKELTELNKSFIENKAKMKETSDEMKALEKEQKSLDSIIKSGTATEEQKTRYKDLSSRIDEARMKMAQLKTTEQDLKSKTSAATAELKNMNSGMKDTKSSTETAKTSLQGLGTALKALAMGYTGKKLYDWLIGSNADMEQYVTSFTVMLGSAQKAQTMIKSMTEFAAKTPLELTDIVSTGQLLMNYGVSAENLIPTMQKLGDLAGGNAEKLNRVALAYGQMLAKGKVSGEELRQMTEAGVPLLQTLATTTGQSTAEVSKSIEKGKIGIGDLDKAIASLTTGNGKFAGMMEQQSQTMNGLLSTMKDNFAQFGRDAGETAFQQVKSSLKDVMDMLTKASQDGTLRSISQDAGDALKVVVDILTGVIKLGYDCKDVIGVAAAAIITYKVATVAATAATKAGTVAQAAFNAVMNANPYVVAATALASVGAAVFLLERRATAASRGFESLLKSGQSVVDNAEKQIAVIKRNAEIYDSLREKTNLTATESAQLKTVAEELQTALGNGVKVIDSQTGAYNDLTGAIDQTAESMRKQAKLEGMKEAYSEAVTNIDKLKAEIDSGKKQLDDASWFYSLPGSYYFGIAQQEDRVKLLQEYEKTISDYEGLKLSTDDLNQSLNGTGNATGAATDATDELAASFETATNAADLYKSAQKEVNDTHVLSLSTLKKITEQYPEMQVAVDKYLAGQLNEKQVVNELAKYYKTDADNYYRAASTKLKNDTSYYNSVLANNATLVNSLKNSYGIDLRNYASYAKARTNIVQQIAVAESFLNSTVSLNAGVAATRAMEAKLASLRAALSQIDNMFSGTSVSAIQLSSPTLGTVSSSGGSSGKSSDSSAAAEVSIYEKANEAYKKLVQDRIDAINAEKDAKKEALDASIDAINKEIEARKRLSEDRSVQKEIDAVNAQLKYAQLDDFSRMELEKKKKSLLDEQQETAWQRAQENKKESLQAGYDAAVQTSNGMVDRLQSAISYANDLFSSLKAGSQTVSSIINNNSRSANVSIVDSALTAAQIARAVRDELFDEV